MFEIKRSNLIQGLNTNLSLYFPIYQSRIFYV